MAASVSFSASQSPPSSVPSVSSTVASSSPSSVSVQFALTGPSATTTGAPSSTLMTATFSAAALASSISVSSSSTMTFLVPLSAEASAPTSTRAANPAAHTAWYSIGPNIIKNSGFEAFVPPNCSDQCSVNSANVSPWSISSNKLTSGQSTTSTGILNLYLSHGGGFYSFDLSSSNSTSTNNQTLSSSAAATTVNQKFELKAGSYYNLTFWVNHHNTSACSGNRTGFVNVTGFNPAGFISQQGKNGQHWEYVNYFFLAQGIVIV